MPTKPPSRCTTCRRLHAGTGKCPDCKRQANSARSARRGTTTEQGLGWSHQKAAAQILATATHCAICGRPPSATDPLTAGHIIARELGGTNDPSNYQPEHRSCNLAKRNPGRRVVLVTGPPCAGKTTYAHAHAGPGETILDLDAIARDLGSTRHWMHDQPTLARAEAIMQRRIDSLFGGGTVRTWVIRCIPAGRSRAALARKIRADQVVVLLPALPELTARALQRPDRMATLTAINQWMISYTQDVGDTVIDH